VKEIYASPNFLYSYFPHCETHIELLDSQVPPSGSRQMDVCQILFPAKNKNRKKRLLSVWVAELTSFQCSNILNVDDDMYPIP
jgi:hypothetical protein